MAMIAKGGITLSPVNDAYTVLLTPSSCSISADFDGSNANCDNAKGEITIQRGTKSVLFRVVSIEHTEGINVSPLSSQPTTKYAFKIEEITDKDVLSGAITFVIKTEDGFGYQTSVQFSFNVVRESSMLDWIKDWEGSKTKVGGTYVMTPKLFVGKKEAILDTSGLEPAWKQGALTGIYLGPDLQSSGGGSIGIYGYLKDNQIFHLNSDGGYIGGWTFDESGITSQVVDGGSISILSEGSIIAKKTDNVSWGIYANGDASFMGGKVRFSEANGGEIVGWNLKNNRLSNSNVAIISENDITGIFMSTGDVDCNTRDASDIIQYFEHLGGLYMAADSGDAVLCGYDAGGRTIFSLSQQGVCSIAGWNFNHNALYSGIITESGFTSNSGDITISTSGLRGSGWRFEQDGSGAVAKGHISWDADGNLTLDDSVKLSANQITSGTIATASIKCEGKWELNDDGTGFLASNNLRWDKNGALTAEGTIIANSGKIAGFNITSGTIGVESTVEQSSSTQASWASLTIKKDFFKVGGGLGYAMFGNNLAPPSLGGSYYTVGRIVNNALISDPTLHPSNYGMMIDVTGNYSNYGMSINVQGGNSNYGIKSNAALLAPTFISNQATLVTITSSGGWSVNFAKNNIFLIDNIVGHNLTLPDESLVAMWFGVNELPDDFAEIITFVIRPISKGFNFYYNNNGDSTSQVKLQKEDFKANDVVHVLLTKIDGFKYQVV